MTSSEYRTTLLTLSIPGLLLGTLFLAASLTPSLVPRGGLIQGLLCGASFAAGYGIGVMIKLGWRALKLPHISGRWRTASLAVAMIFCTGAIGVAMIYWTAWQDRLRALMELPPLESAQVALVVVVALGVFLLLFLLARLVRFTGGLIRRRLARVLPGPQAALIAIVATALLFWGIGDGVVADRAMRAFDSVYSELDQLIEDAAPQPTDPLKTGGPGSLLTWDGLGRQGRRMIAAEPDAATITQMTGKPALEPLRVYAGLNSADTPQERAALVLAELIRVGGFERGNLVIATPTGTGWVDPEGQSALEYLLLGDVATVAVQYSYLASWLALLADPEYGLETARAVFAEVYGHWRSLPRETRPKLYLSGLSLGAYNSDLSHDLYQVIGDPYQGALWVGAPFASRTWSSVTRSRNPGSPAWLPQFRDGSVIRFSSQQNHLNDAPAPWGPFRVVFLQYASDAITFYDPYSIWRKPDWMAAPIGPDVSPDLIWVPVVTFLQLTVDLMTAVLPPKGFGHVYAFEHYLDGWISLTDAPGWTADELSAFRARMAAR